MLFSCANAKKIKSYRHTEVSILSIPIFIRNTWIIWCLHLHTHTYTFRSWTYLQYLRCSLPNPPAVEEELDPTGSSECQAWHSCTSKAVKRRHRPLSLNLPVLIPHYLHSRQPHSSCPCIAFHTPKFNLAGKWTCCITSAGWKSYRHCSPPIIFFLRQHDEPVVFFLQYISCLLFSLSGIHRIK